LRRRNASRGKSDSAILSACDRAGSVRCLAAFFAPMLRVNIIFQKLLAKSKAHH